MTLAFATGDPAGIGPSISVRAALELLRDGERILLFGDASQLERILVRAGHAPVPIVSEGAPPPDAALAIVDTGTVDPAAIAQHVPDRRCGAAQLRTLDSATRAVKEGIARALVTAPTSKEAIVLAGTPFVGQTEHLARGAGLVDDDVTMLFLGPRLRTALVTTHLAVRDVPGAITFARVVRATRHLGEALTRLDVPAAAPIAIASLNPHAGENGLFGDEEIRVLTPALEEARRQFPYVNGRLRLVGIVPAETAFRKAADGALAGVVAMMHDQATIASKLLDWGAAVNVTWGLPFVRTSVDHGVAYDAAAQGVGDAESMIAAARMARTFARTQPAPHD